jgi:hypothetical protein
VVAGRPNQTSVFVVPNREKLTIPGLARQKSTTGIRDRAMSTWDAATARVVAHLEPST